ncbi:MAG: aminomethyl-transferring glycine dehydrogenase subunit GcvPB, partial [Deltaproteobacteria bacterium]|nr:aminomethyl-transferring glycine dehydrogenase subunit GcvPB [Deltaproteobacteria bacterium]
MTEKLIANGIVQDELLLWEKSKPGKMGFSMPRRDVESFDLDEALTGDGPDFPHLSEVEVVRHYTR